MTHDLVDIIIDGIQEKKGRDIVVADLSSIITAPTQAFVVCTAGSPSQVDSIVDSVENFARTRAGERPAAIAGRDNKMWVAMDFGTVMVHIFLPEYREYYDIEHLWDDAAITQIPDLD